MQKLIIGEIPYLDCYPYFAPLRKNHSRDFFSYLAAHPSELNAALKRGQIDVSISSSIEYCQNSDAYVVLPELCIGSTGPVGSVLLFSDLPLEDLDEMTISLPAASATSAMLIKVLMMKYYQFNNQFKTAWSEAEAHLLIGDSALREKGLDRYHHVYDLGELWRDETGLPFVFAVWIVRREAATEKREQLIAFHQNVKAGVEEARADFGSLADGLTNYEWISKEKVVQYWRGIDFSLTSQHTKGLLTFYADAEELNLVDHAPNEIEFMEMPI